jgi:hypothetical protein
MDAPDQRLFEADVADAEFLIGARKGWWDLAPASVLPTDLAWPKRIVWIAAAQRARSPDKFYFLLDLKGYRTASPTGTLWDPETKARLALEKWPKGKDGSRFAKVFRTADWKRGEALYHPYDRVAAQDHREWKREQPHLVWTAERTIVDFLEEFYALLQGSDYIGV